MLHIITIYIKYIYIDNYFLNVGFSLDISAGGRSRTSPGGRGRETQHVVKMLDGSNFVVI